MNTLPTGPSTTTAPAPASSHPVVEDSGRGTLSVGAGVVAKIAAQAASELPIVGAASGGILGIGARRDFDDRPKADVQLFGTTAVINLDLGVTYPTPLRAAAETIRAHVRHRVEELSGFDAEQIDIEISWVHPATGLGMRGVLR